LLILLNWKSSISITHLGRCFFPWALHYTLLYIELKACLNLSISPKSMKPLPICDKLLGLPHCFTPLVTMKRLKKNEMIMWKLSSIWMEIWNDISCNLNQFHSIEYKFKYIN
jgi:hypothetical protein